MEKREVRLIDANALLKDISESVVLTTKGTFNAEIRGAYKIINRIKAAPTIDPENLKSNKRMIPLNEVYRVIAGHSNYSGDAILSALTCIAEGKDVKPVKPLETLRPQWISVEDRLPPSGPALIVTIYNKVHRKKELRYPVYYYQSENGDCDFFHFAKVPQVLLKEYSKVLAWMPLPQIYEGLED